MGERSKTLAWLRTAAYSSRTSVYTATVEYPAQRDRTRARHAAWVRVWNGVGSSGVR